LAEDESALDAGEGGGGKPVRVGAGPELAGGDHGRETGPDAGLPAVEAIRQDGPAVVVAFAELAQEVGDRTASFPAPLLLESDEGIGPADQAGPGAEAGEEAVSTRSSRAAPR
jgi:hypothetical protein